MNFKGIARYFEKNGAGIATTTSIILTGLSVYFAIKKAREGAEIREEYETQKELIDVANYVDNDKKAYDRVVLKFGYAKKLAVTYKESLICAAGAMASAFTANKINGNKIAGLAAALAINEDKLRKVYSKAEQMFGKDTKTQLKEMVDSDIPFDPDKEFVKGRHKHRKEPIERFFETFTHTGFESTAKDVEEAIKKAEEKIKKDPRHILPYNKWRSFLGLEDAPAGVNYGWNRSDPFRAYTKLMIYNGEEYIGIFYEVDPSEDYDRRTYY